MTFPTWPSARTPNQRGAVLPSPVVLLSIVAVALAAIAFVATRGDQAPERDITATKAAATPSDQASGSTGASDGASEPSDQPTKKATPKPVVRADHQVVVFNNTRIRGLAGRVSERVKEAGWTVAAADNWYGTVPGTTVYYPVGKKAAGRQLALDLGVARVLPADTDSDMSDTNLTLILTGELD
ncbi:LytR C-terminal domain-containing protein [Pimelobacter simplex]|uniref:LytR family transcriptional regulator n=1 Tax=Nocardioides simplex TaxID=2045 RepID=A0A7J5E1G7_NOCSI|nr:LytR C-terminal domain-containing protein [Pimelobacter simplex]KAB2812028.1 LytR family transcriptional regulator [Pimelobacter simplex]